MDLKHYALILGASEGLGLATASKLIKEGIPVIGIHRDLRKDMEQVLERFAPLGSGKVPFHAINKDAVGREGRDAILEKLSHILGDTGRVRVLVHSLARGNLGPMKAGGESPGLEGKDLALTSEAMAFSLYEWTRSLYDRGMMAPDTRIIAFTSEGSRKVIPGYGAVAAAKAGLEALVRQIAVEFAPQGVRANCIQAGVTETRSLLRIPGSQKLLEASRARNPSGRLTAPEDIANAVYLLTLPEASWITGSIIPVDGGEHLQ
ncbi:SDR family oxidoreductase [Robiginitalea marina]|uniref:SDR family oxidoreductase n=1 Tax=Robiginitalea marina TaxID=2954105 RepID=A0ABT1AU58_9FLAO|nr:SDR family oxidoreductase [Robiginitalea marina]MCO5723501.1 SDR family oxidoreductase [Robiginitalea marina]